LTTSGWAMDLVAGAGSDSTEYSFFSVGMRLTDAGHGKISSSFCSLIAFPYFF
jgi:hypothetical protein